MISTPNFSYLTKVNYGVRPEAGVHDHTAFNFSQSAACFINMEE